MADPQISIRITASSDGVEQAVDAVKDHIERAQRAAELASDALGIKVPAALQEILAKSALVGPALEAAFPAVGTIAMLQVVQQLPERIKAVADSLTQLSAEEKQNYQDSTTEAKKHLQVQEAQVRAAYELQAANASDDIQKQAIRVREAAALVQVSQEYRDELSRQKQHFDDLINGAKQFAKELDDAAEASDYDIEKGADLALMYGAIQEKKAENIEKSKEYKSVVDEVALAEARVTSAEANLANQRNRFHAQNIVDLTSVAHAKSVISAAMKKQTEEEARADLMAADALAEFWRRTSEEARKAAEQGQRISEIYSEGELAHTQALQQQARQRLDFELSMGTISQAEHDRRLRAELDVEYDTAKKILQARLAMYRTDSQEYARTEVALRKLEDKHNADVEKADQQSLQKRTQLFQHSFQQISGVFNTAINSWVEGTETAGQAFARMFNQIIANLASMVEQYVEKKLEMWLMDKLLTKQNAEGSIGASAGKVYSAAFADMASLGPEGLAAAPAVASGMASLAEGGGKALADASAAGGQWEVPAVQTTLLHPQEMVLPAGIATRMRAMVEDGGLVRSNLHFSFAPVVHALDAEGMDRVLTKHQRLFESKVDKYLRKKGLTLP